MVETAKDMCLSLLDSVKEAYEAFKERGPPNRGGYGGGDRGGYHSRGGDRQNSGSYGGGSAYGGGNAYGGGGDSSYGAYGQNYGQGYGQQGYGGAQSPTAAQAAPSGDPAEQMKQYEAWAAYYTANPSADPYAAYGGYAVMMAQYMQGYGQTSQTPTNGSAPPPPPDDSNPPPPPPPPGMDGGYGSVSFNTMSSLKVVIRLTSDKVPPPPGL